jgi:iron complex transport system permease protein
MSSRRPRHVLHGALVFCLVAVAVAPLLGERLDLSDAEHRFIFWELRLPRTIMGLVCGAGLAMAGVVLQALLKNPLATPYTLGVSSGAAFGVVLAIVAGLDLLLPRIIGRPIVGMAGAVLVIGLTYRAARVRGRLPTHTLLLAGIALTYIFSALILATQYTATPDDAARILRWLVGSLESGAGYWPPLAVGIVVLVGMALTLPLGRAFNALAGGEEAALGVGVEVDRVVRRSYVVASLTVGVIVAFVGPIGFIGLFVPHTLRLLGLVDNRLLIPAAALLGGGFLALCDGITNLWPTRPLPVGVLTQVLGGPFFLLLLLREKKRFF